MTAETLAQLPCVPLLLRRDALPPIQSLRNGFGLGVR